MSTCDQLLTDAVYPVINGLLRSGTISNWFFIRYSDPDFHLRIRLELNGNDKMSHALDSMNRRVLPLCRDRILHRVTIDTYERELERYGANTIETTERLFDIDSHCVCQLLRLLLNQGKGPDRWRLAFIWIDALLNAFGLNVEQKRELMAKLSNAYLCEFGYNEHNIKPLAKRYRHLSDMIDQMLNGNNIDKACSVVIRRYFNKIKRLMMTTDVKQLNIPSILHMSMNRMFASQNRLNELVLYYCLERHYRKEVKRQKR